MPWQMSVNNQHSILELHLSGTVSSDDLTVVLKEFFNMVENVKIYLILADCTLLTDGHSVFDLYSLANHILQSPLVREFREAVLLPKSPNFVENVKFWETVCFNRGIQVQIFDDRDKAIAWLLQ